MTTALSHEDKMKLLDALGMLAKWLDESGHDWTEAETEAYEKALAVIGPLDL